MWTVALRPPCKALTKSASLALSRGHDIKTGIGSDARPGQLNAWCCPLASPAPNPYILSIHPSAFALPGLFLGARV
ncbi:hypothetical protein LAX5112_01111 [Roseibium alexandrii]|uniref:Uncharacterized protein n=1 Tax=Roseibium alexandrii TaxID=388408 RepID=A0A0M6ZX70_9HYPH|nr:hypothetical protein LAX5112_01111 [Roseibium alexandrii]